MLSDSVRRDRKNTAKIAGLCSMMMMLGVSAGETPELKACSLANRCWLVTRDFSWAVHQNAYMWAFLSGLFTKACLGSLTA